MNTDYNEFFHLPHTRAEGDWMEERLSTLSAKESITQTSHVVFRLFSVPFLLRIPK